MRSPPPPPSMIAGRYRVERVIGEGGGGVVVEAVDITTGEHVAVKMLRKVYARDEETVARFEREARVTWKLASDHVARVSHVGKLPSGDPFIVMELLSGNDLQEELAKRGAFPISEAVDLVMEASVGLAEAHAHGVVHRDVKPSNLFLHERPNTRVVKVIDFGLTKENEPDLGITTTANVLGTPQYMAPEQLRSAKHVDARADQHGLALVLLELLTGRPAFQADSPAALMMEIGRELAPRLRSRLPDAPQALDDAIARALAKEPEERFDDIGAFARAIAPFGGPKSVVSLAAIDLMLRSVGDLDAETEAWDPRGSSFDLSMPTPMPADVDAETIRIDPDELERARAKLREEAARQEANKRALREGRSVEKTSFDVKTRVRAAMRAGATRTQLVVAGAIAGSIALVLAVTIALLLRGSDATASADTDASLPSRVDAPPVTTAASTATSSVPTPTAFEDSSAAPSTSGEAPSSEPAEPPHRRPRPTKPRKGSSARGF